MLVNRGAVVGQRVEDQVDVVGVDLSRHLGQDVCREVAHAVVVEAGEVDHRQDAAKRLEAETLRNKFGVLFDVASFGARPAADQDRGLLGVLLLLPAARMPKLVFVDQRGH